MDSKKGLVVVVGSSGDIARSVIKVLKDNNYMVKAMTRTPSEDEIHIDVTSDESVKRAFESVFSLHERIYSVLYFPAITKDKLIHNQGIDDWQSVIDVNLLGAVRVVKNVLPHFIKNREGIFQFLSSTAAVRGATGAAAYSCSKAALNMLAKNIANDYGCFNVRAYTVMPGYIDGGMLKNLPQDKREAVRKNIALQRMANVQEIANFCVGLLAISDYLTGTTLTLDGGM
ncbi:SDR family NAD(P)-dependent oxidoreductase [Xenorhabdus griffiniae]|uniref:SDR family oxidoreductase n=1 Tax=Xenorhabdus griffiniae TaxID=351672 RepID=A0ABY9XJB7_9GAMM|nr:SDR family oxidoreductase [Xenorhabdus griffiniae]MBD1228688.1 SDR family oxidoreductase [Xenorhabdus griffiniae]MBE8588314.1 SDR family oxidoreductase [Xenorhabdus griffiniae]WMV72991.1 SDR family oxidoreductase [Xenorhabdus griffiniae]WNH02670.1 SDR family oxidoreductase [Xenorhabdus griffiniae]